ncbi:YicC/YloC family endoribonuclease [Rhizobium sp. L1K21]|uniref:YicC/YloC family endoribonuclease n=1 Tax=Rhizobium sp. L1K21 TaxID=2954933 RepID=UPI002092C973|nr:YicC/YloC family endoribonuclease [Rhizobium sp. L1K21]MCO6186522.1 YicC family protein [Rhizobium sp. L1K21]
MTLQSMTGFARTEGTSGRYRWAWELRSVNGKGLDVRLRLPPGLEGLETECRKRISAQFTRGNMQVGLTVSALEEKVEAIVNEDALAAILALKTKLGDRIDPAPLKFDTLLMMRGVVDLKEPDEAESQMESRNSDFLDGLSAAITAMREMREKEGAALREVLLGQVSSIEALALKVENDPSRSAADIAQRLQRQVEALLTDTANLDRDRLYAEAALLAAKSDLREEIDRLKAHVAAARDLLGKGGPVGRKLDFLAQEFNRETNTICSKSNAIAVTEAGLELKVIIDQFREQVQNLE